MSIRTLLEYVAIDLLVFFLLCLNNLSGDLFSWPIMSRYFLISTVATVCVAALAFVFGVILKAFLKN